MIKSIFTLCLLITTFQSYSQYCVPTTIGCSGDYISNVTFGGINRSSICDSITTGYGYYANYMAVVSPGQTLPISLSPGTPFPQLFKVWIDFDMDYTFSTNELVYSSSFLTSTPITGTVTIPVTTTSGVTRMRVRCADQVNAQSMSACQNITFGETEDYSVTIDGMPTSLPSERRQQELLIFPNPATNSLFLKSSTDKKLVGKQVDILNIYGQKVISEMINADQSMAIDQLPNGIYFLVLNGIYQRFVVKHE